MSRSPSRVISASFALCAAALLSSAGAIAQTAQIKAGTLTCEGKGAVGLILGSKEKLSCVYKPSGGGEKHHYDGTITRVGLDIGIRGKSVMVWGGLGSTEQLPGDALGGTFAGASGDVSAGVGAGANILIGGNKGSVTLQPLSFKGQTGVNLALGVAGLNLVPVAR